MHANSKGCGRMHSLLTPAAVMAVLALCGCEGRPVPSAPNPLPAVATPPAVPLPNASLAIEQQFVVVHPQSQGDPFVYELRFQLRETNGISGATIQNVSFGYNGGTDNVGPGCWGDTLRVLPGGTLDTFYTDAGQKWLGYCAPWSGGRTETPQLRVVVTFTDDDGRTGTTEATATVIGK